MDAVRVLFGYWWIFALVVFALCWKLVLRFFGVLIVPDNHVGKVNKKFVIFGSNKTLPDGKVIALNGEAGWQADTLAPGLHFFKWPWQYEIILEPFTIIDDGYVGTVQAKDGRPLADPESNPTGRVLGKHVECESFQDARAFLRGGGERGPQLSAILPGTYRINSALFEVKPEKIVEVPDRQIGIVTTAEGTPLDENDIAGPAVPGHNMFQNGQAFVNAKGRKGRQTQVLLAGKYNINPLFATVEFEELTPVPIAHAGVVISYVGEMGEDVTGASFQHGNMVEKGHKGVWVEPLDPGMYPINRFTMKVESVSTANIVLNWATNKTEAHKLDEHLSTIRLRSSDGFDYPLDVSQIIHIPRNHAPRVIAQFGSVLSLVTQVLEPIIGNYFRNAAQSSTVIEFVRERQRIQAEAKACIAEALSVYNVVAVDTLIGDIVPPPELMQTLKDRKIAEQEKITYATQRKAEEVRKSLQEASALADTQKDVVSAQRRVTIAELDAKSTVKKAEGEAASKQLVATADAMVIQTVGQAEADRTLAIGSSEAEVVKLKVASMTSDKYAGVEIARALAQSGFQLVPHIVAGGNGTGGGSIVDVLVAMMVKDQVDAVKTEKQVGPALGTATAPAKPADTGAASTSGTPSSN